MIFAIRKAIAAGAMITMVVLAHTEQDNGFLPLAGAAAFTLILTIKESRL